MRAMSAHLQHDDSVISGAWGGADVCKLWRDESNRPLNCGGRQVGKIRQPIAAPSVVAAAEVFYSAYLHCRGTGAPL